MDNIRIHVFHCGRVCVSPYLPFGGKHCSLMKAAGLTTRKKGSDMASCFRLPCGTSKRKTFD